MNFSLRPAKTYINKHMVTSRKKQKIVMIVDLLCILFFSMVSTRKTHILVGIRWIDIM